MFFHSCLKSPGRLPNVGLPTAAGDLVDNLGLLLCWQCVLNFGQDGLEGSPGFDPQAKLPADSPDVLADTWDIGEHHQWGSLHVSALLFRFYIYRVLDGSWPGRGVEDLMKASG